MNKHWKYILVLSLLITACHIPHPSNYTGVRTLRPVEKWEKVCTEKVYKGGEKVKHCKWVRMR